MPEASADIIDYDEAAADIGPSAAEVRDKLVASARMALKLKHRLERLEDIQTSMTAALQALVRHELPELLATLGAKSWSGDGLTVKVGTRVAGTLSRAPDVEVAIKHLVDNGFGGAVLTSVTMEFGEAERELAARVAKVMSDSFDRDIKMKRDVHHSTLAAWVKARLAEGKPVPLGALGCTAWREASVKEG